MSDLARIADLKVISRTSANLYENGNGRNSREIGQQLALPIFWKATSSESAIAFESTRNSSTRVPTRNRERRSRHFRPVHITLPLPCGARKRQNMGRGEMLGDYARNVGSPVSVTRAC